jgi:plastocyanin
MRKLFGPLAGLALILCIISCGGSDVITTGPPPPPPTCTPANTFCMGVQTFIPTTLTVPVNTTVAWTNDSGSPHNVTWDTPAGRNAAGLGDGTGNITDFSQGSHTRKFTTAGTFTFTCTIHAGMTGTLTVTP